VTSRFTIAASHQFGSALPISTNFILLQTECGYFLGIPDRGFHLQRSTSNVISVQDPRGECGGIEFKDREHQEGADDHRQELEDYAAWPLRAKRRDE